jgi:hypothetical protein
LCENGVKRANATIGDERRLGSDEKAEPSSILAAGDRFLENERAIDSVVTSYRRPAWP